MFYRGFEKNDPIYLFKSSFISEILHLFFFELNIKEFFLVDELMMSTESKEQSILRNVWGQDYGAAPAGGF